jgi:hypothetical protein
VRQHRDRQSAGEGDGECEHAAAEFRAQSALGPPRHFDRYRSSRFDRQRTPDERREGADVVIRLAAWSAPAEVPSKRRLLEAAELAVEFE